MTQKGIVTILICLCYLVFLVLGNFSKASKQHSIGHSPVSLIQTNEDGLIRLSTNCGLNQSNDEKAPYSNQKSNEFTTDLHQTKLMPLYGVDQYAGVGSMMIAMLVGGAIMLLLTKYVNYKELKRKFIESRKARRKEEMQRASKSCEESYQQQNKLQAITIHELCTPLSYIADPLRAMIRSSELPPSLLKQAQTAYYNSISIQELYNQLLEIYEPGKHNTDMRVAPYSASKISDAVIRSFYGLLNSNSITLRYDKENRVDREIWVDRQRIEFILHNILSNACRRISYSGTVSYAIDQTIIDGKEYCVFTISDDAKKRNGSYHTLVTNSGNGDLTGPVLEPGLELMERLVSRHHSKIAITQNEEETHVTLSILLGKKHFDKDTDVTFIEPEEIIIEEEPQEEVIPEEEEEISEGWTPKITSTGKPKLLIIEDYKDIHLYLKVLFSHEYTLIMAENGEEGLRMARKELPDLIITDVMMPIMDGFECCKRLKEDLKTCHIPIILLTAMVGNEDVVKGIELGADDYILKPFNPEILRTKVRRLIKSRSELKQIYTKLLMPLGSPSEDKVEEVPEEKDPFIAQILQIVEENLQNPEFSVKRLSEMQNMSQPTLYRRVKQLTSFTIVELIRSVRLKRSAELLRTKQYNVQEVAEMVGYNDIPTFRKHFVDFYGTTPSTFVKDGE